MTTGAFVANPGTGGVTFAGDTVAAEVMPISKIDVGGAGASSLVTAANPLPTVTPDATVTGALAALNATLTLPMNGRSSAAIDISGVFVGTIQFEGQVLATGTWTPVNTVKAGSTVIVQTTTTTGVHRLTPAALSNVRVNMTAFTSGSAAINMVASAGAGGTFLNQSLPPGANVIGSVTVPVTAVTATASITTQNLVPAGVATAGSAVELTLAGTNALSIQTTGTYTGALSLQATVDGTNWVTLGGTPLVNVNTGGFLASITSALQSIFQAEVCGFLRVRITALAAVTGAAVVTLIATAGAPALVALDASLPAGANTIGAVTISGTPATTATTTPVTPSTTFTNSVASTNATSIKNSAGTLWSVVVSNINAATRFVKFYNLTVAPTVGTSVPVFTIAVPTGGTVTVQGGSNGLRFGTGIAIAITAAAADTDATAVAANDVKVATTFT